MSLVKWNRNELFPRFDSIWEDFFNKDFYNKSLELGTSIPAVNVFESENAYHLEVALPGCNKEEFKVDVENNILKISSDRKQSAENTEGHKVTRREFCYSSFERSFELPENIDKDKIEAEYVDGILKLNLPQLQPEQLETKKQIAIK